MEDCSDEEMTIQTDFVPTPLILQNLVPYEGATSGTTTGWNGFVDGADDT